MSDGPTGRVLPLSWGAPATLVTRPRPAFMSATATDSVLLDLAPTELPNYRTDRYDGGGLGLSLEAFVPADRDLFRAVYAQVQAVCDASDRMRNAPDYPRLADAIRPLGDAAFLTAAH